MTGTSSPLIGNMKYMLAMLLFLSFNGHHLLLTAIHDSYNWIPLQNDVFARMYSDSMVDFMLRTFTDSFGLAFKMAAPMVVALFLTDVGLGILAKTAPQFNIFVIGVPVKIILGLILLVFLFPGMLSIFEMVFETLLKAMEQFLALLSGTP
jgi:flagellar biosynthetic protein FliR